MKASQWNITHYCHFILIIYIFQKSPKPPSTRYHVVDEELEKAQEAIDHGDNNRTSLVQNQKNNTFDDRQHSELSCKIFLLIYFCPFFNPLTYRADNHPHVKKHAYDCLHVNRIYRILPLGLLQSFI